MFFIKRFVDTRLHPARWPTLRRITHLDPNYYSLLLHLVGWLLRRVVEKSNPVFLHTCACLCSALSLGCKSVLLLFMRTSGNIQHRSGNIRHCSENITPSDARRTPGGEIKEKSRFHTSPPRGLMLMSFDVRRYRPPSHTPHVPERCEVFDWSSTQRNILVVWRLIGRPPRGIFSLCGD
jgi:hypothetical protein